MSFVHNKCRKLGIITYDHNHLKTAQLLEPLYYSGYDITVYALPFYERPAREVLFSHRPNQNNAEHPCKIAERLGVEYKKCLDDSRIGNECDFYLVAGAGILSSECLANKKIINCHPGLIPIARGLDSFKWAIYDFLPVGNTLHFIDNQIDAGEIICQKITPLLCSDTIEMFAARHYDFEINMLLHFEEYLNAPCKVSLPYDERAAHRRMPREMEIDMIKKFEEYKRRFAQC